MLIRSICSVIMPMCVEYCIWTVHSCLYRTVVVSSGDWRGRAYGPFTFVLEGFATGEAMLGYGALIPLTCVYGASFVASRLRRARRQY
jgi:hypothetical protein